MSERRKTRGKYYQQTNPKLTTNDQQIIELEKILNNLGLALNDSRIENTNTSQGLTIFQFETEERIIKMKKPNQTYYQAQIQQVNPGSRQNIKFLYCKSMRYFMPQKVIRNESNLLHIEIEPMDFYEKAYKHKIELAEDCNKPEKSAPELKKIVTEYYREKDIKMMKLNAEDKEFLDIVFNDGKNRRSDTFSGSRDRQKFEQVKIYLKSNNKETLTYSELSDSSNTNPSRNPNKGNSISGGEITLLIVGTISVFMSIMSNNLKIFALGGLHEVGKNCYVLEKNNDLIIVDCGIKFLNGSNLADGTIPNFIYLLENKERIKGLFITHGHEDHIGGIPYLLQLIPNIPIYGSDFSISLLKQKLRGESKEKTTIFQDDTIISTGEFRVSFFRVTHSIPGAFGLIIEFDLVKLAEIGKKGVDLLLSDSTNSEVEGNTPSEAKVVKRLENIITAATGRVIITSFASNVYRLKKVIEIAKKTEKKIVLLGSSLLKMMKAIQKAIASGDSIILTSSPIMDNKFNVEIINNKLFALGAKVYENNKEDLLHASGHACQEDLKLMLTLAKPRYFMPFHGDFRMLKKHGHLAQELAIPEKNIFVCSNGEVVEAKDKEFFLSKKKLPAQPNYVLNGRLLPAEELNNNLVLRGKMSQGGFFLVPKNVSHLLIMTLRHIGVYYNFKENKIKRNKQDDWQELTKQSERKLVGYFKEVEAIKNNNDLAIGNISLVSENIKIAEIKFKEEKPKNFELLENVPGAEKKLK
ncbi:13960_t:CDS:2 [Entrophospora sp. SA101]|nr:13960_t:CDS:2 [Entrophospora sp. SA101]